MPHAGEIGAEGRAAEVIERGRKRTLGSRSDIPLELRQHALAIGLAERDQTRSGGYPVRDYRVEESVKRRRERNEMRGADDADRNRINEITFASRNQPIQRRMMPCGPRNLDKRPALRRGLQMPLARGRKGRCELSDFPERRIVVSRRSPVRMRQKDRIADTGTVHQRRPQPLPQRCRIGDVAGFHRPFDAARIRECPDRKGRREPCHQPVERGGFAF